MLKLKLHILKITIVGAPLRTNPSLHELFSYDLMNEKLQDIADVPDPNEEFQLPLDEGFRARPSIGTAAMLSRMAKQSIWKDVFEAIESVNRNSVKIFLSSSILEELVLQAFHPLQELFEEWQEQGLSQNIQIGGV